MTRRPALAVAMGRPVLLAGAPADIVAVVSASLTARGLPAPRSVELATLVAASDDIVGAVWLSAEPAIVASLLPAARAAATAGRPLVVLAESPRARVEAIAAVAHLRAHGAAVFSDPDAWLEAIVLVAAHGAPVGPRTAVVAPADGYLAAVHHTLGSDDGRRPIWVDADTEPAPTDVVLIADHAWSSAAPTTAALRVPLCARGERVSEAPPGALVGLRPALAAVAVVGRASERARLGLGPAGRPARAELGVDEERLGRQLAKIGAGDRRLGDHETKVLLAAYGVAITRQAVATSPSAALRLASKAGFPVDVKAWGPDVATEADGAPIERGLTSAAEVRRAFAAVVARAGGDAEHGAAIVRATPTPGRAVRARFVTIPHLGATVLVETAGAPLEAAAAPLRLADATALAAGVVASRAGDAELDRVGLANLLRRASHLAVDCADVIAELELAEVTVAPGRDGAVVVDAALRLRA